MLHAEQIILLDAVTPPQVEDEKKRGNGRLLGVGALQLVAWLGGWCEVGGENNKKKGKEKWHEK